MVWRLVSCVVVALVAADSSGPPTLRFVITLAPDADDSERTPVTSVGALALATLGGPSSGLAAVLSGCALEMVARAHAVAETMGGALVSVWPADGPVRTALGPGEVIATVAPGRVRRRVDRNATLSLPRAEAETLLEGRVVSRTGTPIAAALVRADPHADDVETLPSLARTGIDGRFRLHGLGSVPVSLAVTAPRFGRGGLSEVLPGAPVEVVLDPIGAITGVIRLGGQGRDAEVAVGGSGIFPPLKVRAGADGAFVVSPLPHGIYWIRATVDGGRYIAESGPVAVTEAALQPMVELSMAPAVAFVGTVRSGKLPVGGAIVMIDSNELSLVPRFAVTSADARFTHLAPAAASQFITVFAPGLPPARSRRVERAEIAGDAGVVVDLPASGVVVGSVIAASGESIAGARIEVESDSQSDGLFTISDLTARSLAATLARLGQTYRDDRSFRTDSSGRFHLAGIVAGRVVARASHPEFASGSSKEVGLAAGGEVAVTIRLARGASVAGVVEDTMGRPIAGAAVLLYDLATRRCEGVTKSGENGRFRMRSAMGRKRVEAAVDPYAPASITTTVAPGGSVRELRLVLADGDKTIAGRVVDEADLPVDGAVVSLRSVGGEPSMTRETTTDESGRFEFTGLPDWSFALTVAKDGYPTGRRQRVGFDREIEIRLARGGRIVGRVTRERFRLVESFRVALAGTSVVVDGVDGRFEMGPVAAGEYSVRVTADGLVAETSKVHVKAGDAAEVEIDLEEAAAIAGEVLDRDNGRPIAQARVGAGGLSATTDAHGRFRLASLKPGAVRIGVSAPGFQPLTGETLELRRGEEIGAVRLELKKL